MGGLWADLPSRGTHVSSQAHPDVPMEVQAFLHKWPKSYM